MHIHNIHRPLATRDLIFPCPSKDSDLSRQAYNALTIACGAARKFNVQYNRLRCVQRTAKTYRIPNGSYYLNTISNAHYYNKDRYIEAMKVLEDEVKQLRQEAHAAFKAFKEAYVMYSLTI